MLWNTDALSRFFSSLPTGRGFEFVSGWHQLQTVPNKPIIIGMGHSYTQLLASGPKPSHMNSLLKRWTFQAWSQGLTGYHSSSYTIRVCCVLRSLRTYRLSISLPLYRKPVLIVRPRIKNSALPQGFAIRILTAIETSVFPLRKLAPDRNNLRNICNNSNEKENIELLPTPHYNTSILEVRYLLFCK